VDFISGAPFQQEPAAHSQYPQATSQLSVSSSVGFFSASIVE
jgi:hypothetical protein